MSQNGPTVVCTLVEGDFFYGVGALLNSMAANGFSGDFWIAYKGPLHSCFDLEHWQSVFGPNIKLRLHHFPGELHFTHRKAELMQHILNELGAQNVGAVMYIDPDIVLKCSWSFIEDWVARGISAVEDVNSPRTIFDPRRQAWKEYAVDAGMTWKNDFDLYVNAGFVGIPVHCRSFLPIWQKALDLVFKFVPSSEGIKRPVNDVFETPDQDAFNIAICCTDLPLSLLNAEAMDFRPGGHILSHAIGGPKPWRKNFIASALRAMPPRQQDKAYLKNVEKPLRLYPNSKLKFKRLSLALGSLVGRFYRRN